jgi:hypothetical protein
MISLTLKMAAERAMEPILAVFSRQWGVSEMTDAGMAIESFLDCIVCFLAVVYCILLLRCA